MTEVEEEELLYPLVALCTMRVEGGVCGAPAPFIVSWPGAGPASRCQAHADLAVGIARHMGFEVPVVLWAQRRAALVEARRAAKAAALLTGACPRWDEQRGAWVLDQSHRWVQPDFNVCGTCGFEASE